jgi:hypothetical protein
MKLQIILWFVLLTSISNPCGSEKIPVSQEVPNFDWIIGNWIRTNDKKDLITNETWKKLSEDIYLGEGVSIKDGERVFVEHLRLLKKGGSWIYEVTGVNEDTTNFVIREFSENSFIATNQENPFPKKIEYLHKPGTLTAVVSNDDKKVVFEFKTTEQ